MKISNYAKNKKMGFVFQPVNNQDDEIISVKADKVISTVFGDDDDDFDFVNAITVHEDDITPVNFDDVVKEVKAKEVQVADPISVFSNLIRDIFIADNVYDKIYITENVSEDNFYDIISKSMYFTLTDWDDIDDTSLEYINRIANISTSNILSDYHDMYTDDVSLASVFWDKLMAQFNRRLKNECIELLEELVTRIQNYIDDTEFDNGYNDFNDEDDCYEYTGISSEYITEDDDDDEYDDGINIVLYNNTPFGDIIKIKHFDIISENIVSIQANNWPEVKPSDDVFSFLDYIIPDIIFDTETPNKYLNLNNDPDSSSMLVVREYSERRLGIYNIERFISLDMNRISDEDYTAIDILSDENLAKLSTLISSQYNTTMVSTILGLTGDIISDEDDVLEMLDMTIEEVVEENVADNNISDIATSIFKSDEVVETPETPTPPPLVVVEETSIVMKEVVSTVEEVTNSGNNDIVNEPAVTEGLAAIGINDPDEDDGRIRPISKKNKKKKKK